MTLALCLLSVALAALTGCSKPEARYPSDFARYQRIDKALDTLQAAYIAKDLKTVNSLRLPLDDMDRLESEIQRDFDVYAEIKVDFSIERIMIEGNTIEMYVHWNGHWKKTPVEEGVRERGHGMLRWVGVHSILLSSYEGELPFGMASREAAVKAQEMQNQNPERQPEATPAPNAPAKP